MLAGKEQPEGTEEVVNECETVAGALLFVFGYFRMYIMLSFLVLFS